jgi:H+/Cl- antiporter ClcA
MQYFCALSGIMRNNSEIIPVAPSLDSTINDAGASVTDSSALSVRVLPISLQAIANAILIGIVAKLLVMLIDLVTNIAFYNRFSFTASSPAQHTLGWVVIFVPIAGSLLVGLMARFGSSAIRGHGIPEAMEKIILNESKIPPRMTFLKPLSAAISIGTGGPFGAEGPIIATGGAFGSLTGQIMRISSSERKIMLTAGACGGMAAIFGTPLAAVMLAIELLLFEFSPKSIIPVALSCTTGTIMHYLLFGTAPVFAMSAIQVPDAAALVTYFLMGMLIGVVAAFISKSVYWVEDAFEKLPFHWMWWPAIGAVAVGVIGYFAPVTMGVGYSNISSLLAGHLGLSTLLVLCILKYLSWVISLGSGTSGGTLAPLFTIGGATGALLGMFVLQLIPGSHINIAVAALIGMAAMFAGASRAILTSILFALETTGQMNGLLPLLGACTAAYFVSFFLIKGSIMTEKIQRRGVKTPDSYEPDLLRTITAGSLVRKVSLMMNANNTVGDMRAWLGENLGKTTHGFFIVADENENFAGYVNRKKIINPHTPATALIGDILTQKALFVYGQQDVGSVSEIMGEAGIDVIAVIAADGSKKITGVISASDIIHEYSEKRRRETDYHRSLSIPRRTMRVIVKGKTLMRSRSEAVKE